MSSQVEKRAYNPHAALFEFVMITLYLIGMGSAAMAVATLFSSENVRASSEFAIASALSLGLMLNSLAHRIR